MRFVIFGANGQLGADLAPLLPGAVTTLARCDLDLSDAAGCKSLLEKLAPEVVINCAAFNFVDRAETEPQAAFAVNASAVHYLARACAQLRLRFVHFSSDYVFGADASRNRPYGENDAPGPLSVYGASKLAGEYLALAGCPGSLVIRTCGLYGLHGKGGKRGNFIETMLRLAREGKRISVIGDQVCTPSYTADVAAVVVDLIQKNESGIYHVTNTGSCSWHELAAFVFQAEGLKPELIRIGSREFAAAADRPAFSVFALDKLASAGVARPRPWQEAVKAYLAARVSQASGGMP
jgi:dTDP-4-dehydrorhamnose reductase